jgi:hypothetical protein
MNSTDKRIVKAGNLNGRTKENNPLDKRTDKKIQSLEKKLRNSLSKDIRINYDFSSINKNLGENADQSISKAIDDFLNRNDYRSFQLDDLGVYGGAFGVSHNSRENFILLQSTDRPAEIDVFGVNIPCLPEETARQCEQLIDYLFLGRRGKQPLADKNSEALAPEFYWHLAQIYYPELKASQGRFPISDFDIYLRDTKKVPFLYCPVGEVAFFLYAWRLLIRLRQQGASTCNIDDLDGVLSLRSKGISSYEVVWSKEFWDYDVPLHPERDWLNALDDLITSEQNAGPSNGKQKFIESVNSQWKKWHENLDTDPNRFCIKQHPWASDWVNLGLLTSPLLTGEPLDSLPEEARPTQALLALVQFALQVEGRGDVLERLQAFEIKLLNTTQESLAFDWDTAEALDHELQGVVHQFLGNSNYGEEGYRAELSELHKIARFPVLPFFYWTAVDREPKEHFVFPVWESWRFPVLVKIPIETKEGPDVRTWVMPTVGIGLLTIKPMYELGPDSFDPFKKTKVYKKAYNRLFQIVRFFSRVGRPLIDSAFYGVLVRDKAVKEGRATEQKVQISKWAHALRTRLAPIQIMLKENDIDLATRYIGLLSQAIHALTEFPELERISDTNRTLKEYYTDLDYTPSTDIYFTYIDGANDPSLFIDSMESFIGISIHALVSKIVIGAERFGRFFKHFGISKEEFHPQLKEILSNKITGENWNEVTNLLSKCNINIAIRTDKRLTENYKPFVVLWDGNNVKLHVGMFVMFLLDELLSNAVKHAQRINGHAWMRADFILQGEYDDACCRLEISNSSTEDKGLEEGSLERTVGSGMNFCKMIAAALNAGEYQQAQQIGNDRVKATYEFPVIFTE